MKHDATGDRTFDTVRDRYKDWFGSGGREPLPGRTISEGHQDVDSQASGGDMGKMLGTAAGVGIGLVLLVLAVLSYRNAGWWNGMGRDGATVGYTVVGFFLTVAGIGAVLATLNHNFRVAGAPGGHH